MITQERTEFRLAEATVTQTARHALGVIFQPLIVAWKSPHRYTIAVLSVALFLLGTLALREIERAALQAREAQSLASAASQPVDAITRDVAALRRSIDTLATEQTTLAVAVAGGNQDAERRINALAKLLDSAQAANKRTRDELDRVRDQLLKAQGEVAALRGMLASGGTRTFEGEAVFPQAAEGERFQVSLPRYRLTESLLLSKETRFFLEGKPAFPVVKFVRGKRAVLVTARGSMALRVDIAPEAPGKD